MSSTAFTARLTGDWTAVHRAEQFLRDHGFSIGPNSISKPRCILYGEHAIPEMKEAEEGDAAHGTMFVILNGSSWPASYLISIYLNTNAPIEVVRQLAIDMEGAPQVTSTFLWPVEHIDPEEEVRAAASVKTERPIQTDAGDIASIRDIAYRIWNIPWDIKLPAPTGPDLSRLYGARFLRAASAQAPEQSRESFVGDPVYPQFLKIDWPPCAPCPPQAGAYSQRVLLAGGAAPLPMTKSTGSAWLQARLGARTVLQFLHRCATRLFSLFS